MASGASTASGTTSQLAGLDSLISPTEEHYARQQKYMVASQLTEAVDEAVPLFYFNNPLKSLSGCLAGQSQEQQQHPPAGLGMFSEAYFVFSIGNIAPILSAEYPECWKSYKKGCTKTLTQVPNYIQIVGIILGMVTLGFIGDRIGRKWGSVTTASLMLLGAILLVSTSSPSEKGFVIFFIVSQFVFGYGVGGEYPMAAGSATERAEARGSASAKKRGREGVGNFVNVSVLCILMPIFGIATPNHPKNKYKNTYGAPRLSGVWRASFAIGFIPLLYMLYYRIFRLRESAVWKKRMSQVSTQKQGGNYALLVKHYWPRLIATAGCWFLWDYRLIKRKALTHVYGNKVFQSSFVAILSPDATILVNLLWTLLNSGIALIGYWLTACVIDNARVGRLRLQLLGFFMVMTLFYVSAAAFKPLTSKGGIQTFQFIYFFSSFWGQFGVFLRGLTVPLSCWLVSCTPLRCAQPHTAILLVLPSLGVCGHPLQLLRQQVGTLFFWPKFWWTSTLNALGLIATFNFLPNPARTSLAETDCRWRFEKYILRQHKYYNRQLDHEELLTDLKAAGYIAPDANMKAGAYGRSSPDDLQKPKDVEMTGANGINGTNGHNTSVV
eukprot:jgi/Astpho2/3210/Aster-05736